MYMYISIGCIITIKIVVSVMALYVKLKLQPLVTGSFNITTWDTCTTGY